MRFFMIREVLKRLKIVVLGMKWVAMARHWLILWENEATGSRRVSKYLLGLRDAIFLSKMFPETRTSKNPKFSFPYIYILPIYRPGG